MYSEAHIYRFYAQGPEAVVALVGRLEARIADLEAQVIRKPQPVIAYLSQELRRAQQTANYRAHDLLAVQRTLARRTQELEATQQDNARLLARVHELEAALATLGDTPAPRPVALDSHNSHQPPASDPPWRKVRRTRSLRRASGLRAGAQAGHPGATLRQVAPPAEVVAYTPAACERCGEGLEGQPFTPGSLLRRQVFELRQGRLEAVEHQAGRHPCPSCGHATRAAFPRAVKAPAQYGPSVLAVALYLHFYQLLPLARTAETMRDLFNCRLSPATIVEAARNLAQILLPAEARLKTALTGAQVLGVDETGLRVKNAPGYVHVARTQELTHYAFDTRRGKGAMDETGILPRFRGTVVRDNFSSYQGYEQCRHSLCNAHLLRDLIYVAESSPPHQVWAEPLIRLLLDIKEAAAACAPKGLSQRQQGLYRRRYEALLAQAEKLETPPAPPGAPTPHLKPQNLIKRLRHKQPDILRFMSDPAVPFDNNGSERDLRMIKLQQKISGCFRTKEGAARFCRIRSYLSSAKKQGYSLLKAIERAFNGKPPALHLNIKVQEASA